MSKASDWVDDRPAAHCCTSGALFYVDEEGWLATEQCEGDFKMTESQALALAAWIIDTFGETDND